jgi:hypothetical protein
VGDGLKSWRKEEGKKDAMGDLRLSRARQERCPAKLISGTYMLHGR